MSEKTYVLWGTKKGDPSYAEQIITETKDKGHLEKAKKWAAENDFVNIRTMVHREGDRPNFGSALRILGAAALGYTAWATANFFLKRSEALDIARSLAADKGMINLGAGCNRDSLTMGICSLPEVVTNADINAGGPNSVIANFESGRLPFADRQFDVAFASHVLEHLVNWETALDEWNRIADRVIVVLPHPLSIMGHVAREHVQHFSHADARAIEAAWPRTKIFQ
ncbi:MAG: methyltransferase domain-containing protein [Dehalococcoidia bacterium]|jgi:SAM-dependent methyltransferase